MSAARRATRAGRNLLIALLVGAVIIVAIVAAYIAGRSSGAPSAEPTSVPIATATATTNASGTADAAPTGCLGGQARNNAMLLAAQKSAPHTTYGAVEVATAFYRWSYRFPVPTASDVQAARAVFVPRDSAESEASLLAGYRKNPNPAHGAVPDATPFFVTAVGGRWTAQTGREAGEQLISIQGRYVIDGAVSATKTATGAFEMRWVDGAWRVEDLAKGDSAKVAAGGTSFTAGC